MLNKSKKSTPRAVVTPMRISRGEDDEQLIAHGIDIDRIPQSVSSWPAVNFDVCSRIGVRVRPLPTAAAVMDQIPALQAFQPTPKSKELEDFLKLVCNDGSGLSFNLEFSRDYIENVSRTRSLGDSIAGDLATDVGAIRELGGRQPQHRPR